jgi:Holliday junction resolvase RusA-like endonuclease
MMGISVVRFFFPGEPVPAARPQGGKWGYYTPAKYRAYKSRLVSYIRSHYITNLISAPSTVNKSLRAKFLKQQKGVKYLFNLIVYPKYDRGDWDNYGKSVCDALEQSELIFNDKQIKKAYVEVMDPNKDDLGIQVELKKM